MPGDANDEMEMVREALRRLMDERQAKSKPLAKAAGMGETGVRDILEGRTKDVKVGTLRRLASQLDASLEELMGFERVKLVGRIGAGGNIIFAEAPIGSGVPRPPAILGPLEAMEVEGESMFPRYSSGDVLYISREHEGMRPEYFGEFCAVRLVSGETYVKLLAKGSSPGFVTLRSLNAPDIEDVELEWATPIIYVLPRFARISLGF